jgi:hypothetical protein
MEFRKMFRGQLILAGLAAALFFTPAAHSQEITNTEFNDGPYVTTFAQPDGAQPSAQAVPVPVAVPSVNEVAAIQASLSTPQVALIDSPWVAAGLTVILLAAIALTAVGESKRIRRNTYSGRRTPSYRGA